MQRITVIGLIFLAGLSCDKSGSGGQKEVVLYTSVDEPVARPIVQEFEKRTGIKVRLKTDTEASKTAGLVQSLRAEKANPQCDVFWNNEPFHTISLAEEGVLGAYESPVAKEVMPQFRDPKNRWASNGLRMRMIAMSPGVSGAANVEDLIDPKFKGKVCMAFPALGTTAGHLAVMRLKWGQEKYEAYLKGLMANEVKLLGGNSEVVKQIGLGNMSVGLTDNDDVDSMIREVGADKIKAVPAAMGNDGPLAIPTTVGLVAGAKHDAEAKQLIDYLLSAEVEGKLKAANFAVRSVRPGLSTSQPLPPEMPLLMEIDYIAAGKIMPSAVQTARKILEGRE